MHFSGANYFKLEWNISWTSIRTTTWTLSEGWLYSCSFYFILPDTAAQFHEGTFLSRSGKEWKGFDFELVQPVVGLGCGLVVCNQSISRKRVTQYVYSCIFYYNIFLPYPGIFVFVVFLRLCSCEAVITRGHCCTQLYSAVLRWLCCFNFHEEIKTKSVLSVQSTCFPFNITYFAFYFNTCFC